MVVLRWLLVHFKDGRKLRHQKGGAILVWWPKMRLEVLEAVVWEGGSGKSTVCASRSAMRLQSSAGYSASAAVS